MKRGRRKAEGGRQKVEGRRQKAEGRRRKAKGGRRKAEGCGMRRRDAKKGCEEGMRRRDAKKGCEEGMRRRMWGMGRCSGGEGGSLTRRRGGGGDSRRKIEREKRRTWGGKLPCGERWLCVVHRRGQARRLLPQAGRSFDSRSRASLRMTEKGNVRGHRKQWEKRRRGSIREAELPEQGRSQVELGNEGREKGEGGLGENFGREAPPAEGGGFAGFVAASKLGVCCRRPEGPSTRAHALRSG